MDSTCFCIGLRRATRRMAALYDEALAPVGINVAQFSLLRLIGRRQPISLSDIGRLAELDRSTVGRNVQVLERQGLAATSRGQDQREALVSLTDKGRATVTQATPLWEACQRRVEGTLGPERSAELRELLDALGV